MRALLLALLLLAAPLRAAELDGVVLPDSRMAEGVTLRLNGIALRTYSIFRVHVYVAGLYLAQPARTAEAVLRQPGPKLVEMRSLRDVGRDDVHRAWRALLDENCPAPCPVAPAQVERFLALSPALRAGGSTTYVVTPAGVGVLVDGQVLGSVAGEGFGRLLLATFIGPAATSPEVRAGLLGTAR